MAKGKIKQVVDYCYKKGITQSLIYHEILFLVLALIYVSSPQTMTKPIIIEFSSYQGDSFSMEDPVLSLNFDTQELEQLENMIQKPSMMTPIIPEMVHMDQESEHVNRESIKLEDINSKDLMKEVALSETVEDNTDKPIVKKSNNSSTATQAPSSKTNNSPRNKLLAMLKAGGTLAEGIPPEALQAGNGDAGSIEGRLNLYGAKTGDIQVSLIWNTVDDIDLHVGYSNNMYQETINWRHRHGNSRGILDIDMNARGPQNQSPVENIFWPYNTAPKGNYVIGVHFFRSWTGNKSVPIIVRVKTLKGEMYYNAVVYLNQPLVTVTTLSN